MSFAPVIGQERAVAALEAHLARTGGAGSTLIVGPDGVGRFLLARCAARAILDDSPLVDLFRHPDLRVLGPESGIDGVREAIRALQCRPVQGPRQVLLVRDADRFSLPAHNALLKTLEEPPADAAVFLVAEEPSLLPATVVSRCRLVRAGRLTDAETAAVLAALDLPADAAADAEGSPGRALYYHEREIPAAADRLLALLQAPHADAIAEAEALVRKQREEESKAHRRRMQEICQVVATRLRRGLPARENVLRSVVEAIGSLEANANPSIVMTDLALLAWKTPPR